jgi:hypothetical protein
LKNNGEQQMQIAVHNGETPMQVKLTTCAKYIASLLALLFLNTACNEDENDTTTPGGPNDTSSWTGTGPYGVISFVGDSYFLGVLNSLNAGTYTQSNAVESDGMHSMQYFNGKIYVPPHYLMGGNNVNIYTVNKNSTLTHENAIPVPIGSGAGPIHFVNATRAYLPLVASGYIWEFNPTTLAVTDEIDLRSYAVGTSESANDDNSPEPITMISRNNKLYVSLSQSYNNLEMGRDVAQVAVINMDTNQVEKIISDTTRGFTMPGTMAGSSGAMFFDEQGNLYVNFIGSWGWVEGQKAGFLRINTTTNEFDTTWDIDFSNIPLNLPGGKIDYLNRMVYAGNGVVYGAAHVPGAESTPVDWVHDRCVSYVKVDMFNKTVEVLPFPATSMYGAALTMDGDYLVVAEYNDSGTGLYVYDTVSQTVVGSPAVTTEGSVMLIRKLE